MVTFPHNTNSSMEVVATLPVKFAFTNEVLVMVLSKVADSAAFAVVAQFHIDGVDVDDWHMVSTFDPMLSPADYARLYPDVDETLRDRYVRAASLYGFLAGAIGEPKNPRLAALSYEERESDDADSALEKYRQTGAWLVTSGKVKVTAYPANGGIAVLCPFNCLRRGVLLHVVTLLV